MNNVGISKTVNKILLKKGLKEVILQYIDKENSATINLEEDIIIKIREVITCNVTSPDDFKVKIFLESDREKKDIHYSFVMIGSVLEKIIIGNQKVWQKNTKNSRENICPQYEIVLDI